MGLISSSFRNSLISKPRQRGDHDTKKGRSPVEEDEDDEEEEEEEEDDDDDDDTDGPASCHCRSRDEALST
jgi:hypothetical protein